MSPKRSAASKASGSKPKRRKKMLPIAEKVRLLNMLKEGISYADVGRHYGINESTVRYINKAENKIRATAKVTFNEPAKRVVTSRNKGIVRKESALSVWISDCRKRSLTLPKRRRKMLTIAEKVRLLNMLKEGRSYADVGRHYGINESTVRYINKAENKIRATAKVTFNETAKRVVTSRNKGIVRMESALSVWISDCRKRDIALDANAIREKARQLYGKFTDDEDPEQGPSAAPPTKPTTFNASRGWFDKFQMRFNLKSVSLRGEADKPAAEEYVNETFNTVEEGGYSRQQVSNTDETDCFCNRMPTRTFIMKEEARAPEFKACKESVTIIMCGKIKEEDPREDEEVGLSLERLSTLAKTAKELQRMAEEWDPEMIRALQFRNAIDEAMEVYKNLLLTHKKRYGTTRRSDC